MAIPLGREKWELDPIAGHWWQVVDVAVQRGWADLLVRIRRWNQGDVVHYGSVRWWENLMWAVWRYLGRKEE